MTETKLIKYDAMCSAIAAAAATDEILQIRDEVRALAAAARVVNNHRAQADFAIIQLRAERRLGQMIIKQKETVGLNTGAKGIGKSVAPSENRTPTLAEAGIDKKLSAQSQKLAALPDDKFEKLSQTVHAAIEDGGDNRAAARHLLALATPPKKSSPDDDEDEDEAEEETEGDYKPTAKEFRMAFLLRAGGATEAAFYNGPITQEIVDVARATASAWTELALQLTKGLKQ